MMKVLLPILLLHALCPIAIGEEGRELGQDRRKPAEEKKVALRVDLALPKRGVISVGRRFPAISTRDSRFSSRSSGIGILASRMFHRGVLAPREWCL